MSDLVKRLRDYALDDHERGCKGRYYDCSCGYDGKRDVLLGEAAARIEALEAALNNIGMYTYPRVPGEYSDECAHERLIGKRIGLDLGCHDCMAAYARAALGKERT